MSNDRTSQLIGRLREAAEWLAEDIPEGTPEIEHLEGVVRLDELDLYSLWLMRQAADALSDPNPILAATVEEAEAARQELEREATRLNARNVEASILAYKWMVAHDHLRVGLPYDLPRVADVPASEAARQSAEARVEALEMALHEIIDLAPATQEVCAASMMADAAREALQPKPADQVSVGGENS